MKHFNSNFLKFKNIHVNESAILFATGPTLNFFKFADFKLNEEKLIKVGVNSIVYKNDIQLDYYFCGHDASKDNNHLHHLHLQNTLKQQIIQQKINKQIFCCTNVDGSQNPFHFNEKDAHDMKAIPYAIHTNSGVDAFKKEISENNLYNHSIVFSALQFILYTGVTKVYLVGCDGGGGFSFLFPNNKWNDTVEWCWKEFIEYTNANHQNVEFISINPKKLKGLFLKEIYN